MIDLVIDVRGMTSSKQDELCQHPIHYLDMDDMLPCQCGRIARYPVDRAYWVYSDSKTGIEYILRNGRFILIPPTFRQSEPDQQRNQRPL